MPSAAIAAGRMVHRGKGQRRPSKGLFILSLFQGQASSSPSRGRVMCRLYTGQNTLGGDQREKASERNSRSVSNQAALPLNPQEPERHGA